MQGLGINKFNKLVLGIGLFGLSSVVLADGWDPSSQATNIGSIANTRHNLTLDYSSSALKDVMNLARNNYGQICVYCHTPHGANKQVAAPLWNRTVNNASSYSIYDRPTTIGLDGRLGLPGPSSLTCLSCHDGTIAIDSILNMPGSGLNPSNGSLQNNEVGASNQAFLDTWAAGGGGREGPSGVHFTMGDPAGAGNSVANDTCANGGCHGTVPGAGSARADFRLFVLGTDLRDDHVVGITFPTTFGPGIDYNEPDVVIPGKWSFFDGNGSGYAEKDEVRLYDSGAGPAVECASCHDPHGIPSNGAGTKFNPSFLRINNSGVNADGVIGAGASALCLTCHAK